MMRNILTRACGVVLVVAFALVSCERPEYRLESLQDDRRVLGIHVNSDGKYEFSLCPLLASYTQDVIASECINPLIGEDGAPKTFSTLPSKPNTLGAKIQTGVIVAATSLAAAGLIYWIGRYFTTIKAGKALGSDLFTNRMDLALETLRGMDNLEIPPRLAQRVLDERGFLKKEIHIAIKHDFTLKKLKLKDGTVLTDSKAIEQEISKWGTTKADLVRDIGNLQKKTEFNGKTWGRELADGLASSNHKDGDIHTIVSNKGMTGELFDSLRRNDLVLREVDGSLQFDEKLISKIRLYEQLTAEELEQLKTVMAALSDSKKLTAKIKNPTKIADAEMNRTYEAIDALNGKPMPSAKPASDPLLTMIKTSGIGGEGVEKIDDLMVSELRALKQYIKDVRTHTSDKGTRAQLKDLIAKVNEEIKSSSNLYVLKDSVKSWRKHAIKTSADSDINYAREAILSSGEVAGDKALLARLRNALRDTFKYKNTDCKFSSSIEKKEELVAKISKGEEFG
ncbi:MAG: hypothetical protein OYH77_00185 [Pseudomonadota bacterium]|nr:hypothetical protein [Pseudomonadota bacterium]